MKSRFISAAALAFASLSAQAIPSCVQNVEMGIEFPNATWALIAADEKPGELLRGWRAEKGMQRERAEAATRAYAYLIAHPGVSRIELAQIAGSDGRIYGIARKCYYAPSRQYPDGRLETLYSDWSDPIWSENKSGSPD